MPGAQRTRELVGTVRGVPERILVREQQVEACVPGRIGLQYPQVFARRARLREKRWNKAAARRRAAPATPEFAEVRDAAESSARVERQPRAICLHVAAADDAGRVGPGCERRRRPGMKLVAVGGDHEPVTRVAAPRED